MGQEPCCGEKDHKNNQEYDLAQRHKRSVSKKEAVALLTPSARKKMQELGPYQPVGAVERGSPSDSYVEMSNPEGFYHGEWIDQQMHGLG